MITIQTNDTTGSVVIYNDPNDPPSEKTGYTIRTVDDLPARAPGDRTSVLLWQNGALALVVPPPTLASLAASLNAALTAIFKTAPIQAQITFSNLAGANGSITQLIEAGELALAEAALQGMLTDQLVPPGYSAFINSAVAAIVAAMPGFAAVLPATTSTH